MSRSMFAALTAVFCLLSTPAWSDVTPGRAAFDAGDYAAAAAQLQPLAEQGDGEAALLMGRMAEEGWGVVRSDVAAWRWYKQAADKGQSGALLRTADFLDLGRGVPVDRRQAYAFYKRAADAGNVRAKGCVGEMTLHGRGRKINLAEALIWLRQAADADDPQALSLLDDLAAAGQTQPPAFGSAAPAEPQARVALEEMRRIIELTPGLASAGPVTALLRDDGSVLVTVPAVSWRTDTLLATTGTVRAVFRDIGDGKAKLRLLLPSRIAIAVEDTPRAVISLAGQELGGEWSFALHRFTEAKGEVVSANLDIAKAIELSFDGLRFHRRLAAEDRTRYTVKEALSAADVALRLGLGGQRLALAAEHLQWRGELRGIDLLHGGLNWPVASLQLQLLLAGERPVAVPREATADLLVEQASLGPASRPDYTLHRLEADLALSDLDKQTATGHLFYSHDGLADDKTTPLLGDVSGSLMATQLPVAEFRRFLSAVGQGVLAQALLPGADRNAPPLDIRQMAQVPYHNLMASLERSRSHLRVEEVAATGPGWDVKAGGQASAAAGRMTGVLDAAVHGLDALLALPAITDAGAGTELRRSARADTDDAGQPVSRFHLGLPGDGRPTLNGKPLTVGGW
jgi:hypothetical protein